MATRKLKIPEKVIQAQIVDLLRHLGAKIWILGHPSPNDGRRFRGTGQSAGLIDAMAFLPARAMRQSHFLHSGDFAPSVPAVPSRLLMLEVKAPGGKLRPEQQVFRDACLAADVAHIVGGYDDVVTWLINYGYLSAKNVPHYRQPKKETL